LKGAWRNPAVGSARADLVVVAPQDGVPLLFVEVDNWTEEATLIAGKFTKYQRSGPGRDLGGQASTPSQLLKRDRDPGRQGSRNPQTRQ
jgi:hypothetical protein